MIASLLSSCWNFYFALGHRICFFGGSNILLQLVVQQLVALLVYSEEKMSAVLSTPLSSVQYSSVAQSCPTLCNTMNCSTPGLPVLYQLPEFSQTPVHWAGDVIQPSHPLPSPPPSIFPSIRVFSNESGLYKGGMVLAHEINSDYTKIKTYTLVLATVPNHH